MSEDLKFPVPEDFKKSAHITDEIYKDLYNESQQDNVGFWSKQGKRIDWIKPYNNIKNVIWSKKKVDINFEECMKMEYRVVCRVMSDKDFYEGVRALIIDKDNVPKWDPKTIEEVDNSKISNFFSSLEDKELIFD